MTRDDIIRMAREAKLSNEIGAFGYPYLPELERFAALVAEAEREACAKVCDSKVDAEYKTGKVDHNEMGWTQACALAIRARGEK
jgi:hypothetical protein